MKYINKVIVAILAAVALLTASSPLVAFADFYPFPVSSGASLSGGVTGTLVYWTSATTVGATTSPTFGYVTATSTATSTFAGPISGTSFTGTGAAPGMFVAQNGGTATSTFTVATSSILNGSLAVGTSTPLSLLGAYGTYPSFVLSDLSGGVNLKNYYLTSDSGNLFIGTSSDSGSVISTSSAPAISILGSTSVFPDGQVQFWPGSVSGNASVKAGNIVLQNNGAFFATELDQTSTSNNARLQINTGGFIVSRNVADGNSPLIVSQLNVSSVGDILAVKNSVGTTTQFTQRGTFGIGTTTAYANASSTIIIQATPGTNGGLATTTMTFGSPSYHFCIETWNDAGTLEYIHIVGTTLTVNPGSCK